MKILPINVSGYYHTNKLNETEKTSLVSCAVQKSDSVSFGSSVKYVQALRELFKYDIPDFYSEIIILDPAAANKIYESKVFSSTVRAISDKISPHVKSLFKIERKFYGIITDKAKYRPNMLLSNLVEEILPVHTKELIRIQMPIFSSLEDLSYEFPGDLHEQFNYLMYVTKKKINNEPVFMPFSIKEFNHKLKRIKARIDNPLAIEESEVIRRLIEIAKTVPEVPKSKRLDSGFKSSAYEDMESRMLDKFTKYFERSILKDDIDIKNLVEISQLKLLKCPTNEAFGRKTFIHELERITDKLEDIHLAHKALQIAFKLPTAKQNLSAFVVKSANRSGEQIGYDMLSGSEGCIDHLVASYKNGENSIYNYILTSVYKNVLKNHKKFFVFYKEEPDIAHYAQHQIDVLIELANRGIFRQIGLDKNYIVHIANQIEKLTSKSNTLILDTNELKY